MKRRNSICFISKVPSFTGMLEQLKANIDIKRTIALKMADARLESLRSLAIAIDRFNTECAAWSAYTAPVRLQSADEYNQVAISVRMALTEAAIFLTNDFSHEIAKYLAFAHGIRQD